MVDVTSALATQGSSRDRDVKGKRKLAAVHDIGADPEDEAYSSAQKRNLQSGAALVDSMPSLKRSKGSAKGGGSFQSLNLSPALLRSILLRGFSTPTPIQRAALPAILALPPRDLVGMARTGSGKTLAYMLPLLERLGLNHSTSFGARALVLVPTRELALQVMLVGKDLARGAKAAEREALRWAMIVGGDSLEDQFSLVASNPDVIIATPGRLLHLAVEMNLELKAVEYVVFDEADRLFELGFATQLREILHRLPANRQTLLFSATLPKSLVEFAKAGLQNPKLVRLDSESKISTDLRMAFFSIKPVEKEAALLCLLRDVIGIPFASETTRMEDDTQSKRAKYGSEPIIDDMAPHQTLVFAATKHHVEYLTGLMRAAGYAVSAIYGALDHAARKIELSAFRNGKTQILCVTDLAARGIDIPLLENVVNYDFPIGAKTFVHRVGRTARAGRKGWAYSLVTVSELAHLLDLQLFLSRPLLKWDAEAAAKSTTPDFTDSLIVGAFPRDMLDQEIEHCRTVLIDSSASLMAMQGVAERGQRMYERSSAKASSESYRRAKELTTTLENLAVHPVLVASAADKAADLLAKIKNFKSQETVFEIGSRGKTAGAQLMKERRRLMGKKQAIAALKLGSQATSAPATIEEGNLSALEHVEMETATDADVLDAFDVSTTVTQKRKPSEFRDSQTYLDYSQAGAESEKGYAINNGMSSFTLQAASASFGLSTIGQGDAEDNELAPQRASILRWDRKTKRIVRGDGTGSDNKKLIRTEAGTRLPATFQSGRFDEWKTKQRVLLPRIGDAEMPRSKSFAPQAGRQYRHKAGPARSDAASPKNDQPLRKARSSLQRGRKPGKGAAGLRSADEIARERRLKEKRTWRSNGPGKKGPKTSGRAGKGRRS